MPPPFRASAAPNASLWGSKRIHSAFRAHHVASCAERVGGTGVQSNEHRARITAPRVAPLPLPLVDTNAERPRTQRGWVGRVGVRGGRRDCNSKGAGGLEGLPKGVCVVRFQAAPLALQEMVSFSFIPFDPSHCSIVIFYLTAVAAAAASLPAMLVIPDLLEADAKDTCAARACAAARTRHLHNKVRAALQHLAARVAMSARSRRTVQENIAPNIIMDEVGSGYNMGRSKRTRRLKQASSGSNVAAVPKRVAAASAAAPAPQAEAPSAASERTGESVSPTRARARKQQKCGDGEFALVRRCKAFGDEVQSKVSPPLGRVQERHFAFSLHSKAMRSRGPSALQAMSENLPGSQAHEVERLVRGVACVELQA